MPRELDIQQFPNAVFEGLGIVSRRGFSPKLLDAVIPVVSIPFQTEGAQEFFPDAETLAGYAFMGLAVAVAGGVGNFGKVQLLNPAGSGRTVWVDTIWLGCSAAETYSVARYDTPLSGGPAAGVASKNGLSGSPQSQLRFNSNTGGIAVTDLFYVSVPAGQMERHPFSPALRLSEGEGLFVQAQVGNQILRFCAEWREYPA